MGDQREWRDCFNLYNSDGSGRIEARKLGEVVRSLGANPTEETLEKIARSSLSGNSFTFDDLSRIMPKLLAEGGFGTDDIREAFRVFDRDGSGFVSATELRHVMTNLGEKLTDEEVDEMIRSAEVSQNGLVAYEDLVVQMVSTQPQRRK